MNKHTKYIFETTTLFSTYLVPSLLIQPFTSSSSSSSSYGFPTAPRHRLIWGGRGGGSSLRIFTNRSCASRCCEEVGENCRSFLKNSRRVNWLQLVFDRAPVILGKTSHAPVFLSTGVKVFELNISDVSSFFSMFLDSVAIRKWWNNLWSRYIDTTNPLQRKFTSDSEKSIFSVPQKIDSLFQSFWMFFSQNEESKEKPWSRLIISEKVHWISWWSIWCRCTQLPASSWSDKQTAIKADKSTDPSYPKHLSFINNLHVISSRFSTGSASWHPVLRKDCINIRAALIPGLDGLDGTASRKACLKSLTRP